MSGLGVLNELVTLKVESVFVVDLFPSQLLQDWSPVFDFEVWPGIKVLDPPLTLLGSAFRSCRTELVRRALCMGLVTF